MAAKTLNLEGAKSASINLVEDADRGLQAVHDVIVAMHANRRSGSANTKTRAEVSGTGKKPFKQKGTGRTTVAAALPSDRSPAIILRR